MPIRLAPLIHPVPVLSAVVVFGLAACVGGADPSSPEGRACAALTPPGPAAGRTIDPSGVDQWLFDEAVRSAVNVERCRRGVAPLAGDPALARAATYHSGDMASLDFFDHSSPVLGRTSLRDRYREVGADYPRVAENLAEISLLDLGGGHFFVRDRAACVFSRTAESPPIPLRTYAGAAEALVALWMKSAGHRRNLLDPAMTRHGAGAAIRPGSETCGDLVVAQDFAG